MNVGLTPGLTILQQWLLGREADIATGREDLGLLWKVFIEMHGREPVIVSADQVEPFRV